jgi:hypothetical protein
MRTLHNFFPPGDLANDLGDDEKQHEKFPEAARWKKLRSQVCLRGKYRGKS